MPRTARAVPPDAVVHVLNRTNRRATMFSSAGDYDRFAHLLAEGLNRERIPLYAYCLMPNHWHLVLRVADGASLARLMRWVTTKHATAWHAYHQTIGEGHLYQGRYKAFVVQSDEHFLALCRYVERNPVRAALVEQAEHWRWSSHRAHIGRETRGLGLLTSEWPVGRPVDWREWVNRPQTDAEVDAIRTAVRRGVPYGTDAWRETIAASTGRTWSLRPRGRPRK